MRETYKVGPIDGNDKKLFHQFHFNLHTYTFYYGCAKIPDSKTRRSDPKFRISDPILRFRIGYPEKISDRIRIRIFRKCQRTQSENPVIRSKNPVSDPRTGWSDSKSSDIQKFRIRFGSQFIRSEIFGSDPIRYPTLNTHTFYACQCKILRTYIFNLYLYKL